MLSYLSAIDQLSPAVARSSCWPTTITIVSAGLTG